MPSIPSNEIAKVKGTDLVIIMCSLAPLGFSFPLQAAPELKLPVLYLLDSISKNVGGIYIQIFSHNLARTFLDAYNVVDQGTKQKLEKVLSTWKQGLNGNPVFP